MRCGSSRHTINNKIAARTGTSRASFLQDNNGARAKEIFSGFIAQEVEQAAKESGYEFSGVDKPGNENDFYSLRYSDFVVPLVKAVQELVNQHKEIQASNNTLQNQIDELSKRIEKVEAVSKKQPSTRN